MTIRKYGRLFLVLCVPLLILGFIFGPKIVAPSALSTGQLICPPDSNCDFASIDLYETYRVNIPLGSLRMVLTDGQRCHLGTCHMRKSRGLLGWIHIMAPLRLHHLLKRCLQNARLMFTWVFLINNLQR